MPLKIIDGKLYGRWDKFEKKWRPIVRFRFGKGWGYRIAKPIGKGITYLSLSNEEQKLIKSIVECYGEALLSKPAEESEGKE